MSLYRTIALLTLVGTSASALATQIAYDGFGVSRPDLNGSTGGTGWNGAWMDIGSSVVTSVGGAGLTYPNLITTPGAASTPDAAMDFSAALYARSFTAPGNHYFVSFLFRPNGWDGMNAGISLGGGYNLIGVPVTMGTYSMRLGHYLFVPTTVNATPDQTVLIVAEAEAVGAATTYRMWVNPVLGQGKPVAQAEYTMGGSVVPTTLYLVNAGSVTTDELRVGTTWEDVTPTTLGSCCVTSSLCISLVQSACLQVPGATWGGAGSTCAGGCAAPGCDTIDFNRDTLYPDTGDIDDFLSVFSGGPCSTGTCGDIDFNNDGLYPDTADIDALLRVFSGGAC